MAIQPNMRVQLSSEGAENVIAALDYISDECTRVSYAGFRAKHSELPARLAYEYAKFGGDYQSEAAFICERTTGHEWRYTGTAYGGDDERWHGEGRCYCAYCGADGDA